MSYKLIRGGYSESINMLRFPLAILVVFVHSFGTEIDVSELHASGLTGLAVYDYIRLFFSVVIARSAVPQASGHGVVTAGLTETLPLPQRLTDVNKV